MGSLTVNSGINIGADGYIWTGTGPAAEPTTGLKIYTTSGVSRLTTYASGLAQVDIASNGKLLAGQGAVILDREGLTAGSTKLNSDGLTIGSISAPLQNKDALKIMSSGTAYSNGGIAFINGAFSPTSAQASIITDSTNNFVLSNNAPDGNLIIGNADTGNNNIYLYNSNVNIMPTVSGEVPGVYGYAKDGPGNNYLRYLLNTDGFYLFDDTYDQFNEPVANASIDRQTGNMRTIGDVEVLGNTTIAGNLSLSNGSVTDPSLTFNSDPNTGFYWSGADFIRVSTGGVQSAIFGADRFLISNGAVSSPGLQFISDQNTGIYSVSADVLGIATGGAQRASISTTTANFTGKVTSNEMGYATIRRTTDVAITTAGTTITWQSVSRSGNISVPVPSDTITVDNAGYYMFSATFATVANLTSLRMTLVRGGVNYVSTLHGAGLGTGVGYTFNFSVGFWSTAGSTYKVILTPSANTTLIASAEATAGPSPIINIFQAIGV